jgi:hypothetical protein
MFSQTEGIDVSEALPAKVVMERLMFLAVNEPNVNVRATCRAAVKMLAAAMEPPPAGAWTLSFDTQEAAESAATLLSVSGHRVSNPAPCR